jgi:hypothetical protein
MYWNLFAFSRVLPFKREKEKGEKMSTHIGAVNRRVCDYLVFAPHHYKFGSLEYNRISYEVYGKSEKYKRCRETTHQRKKDKHKIGR